VALFGALDEDDRFVAGPLAELELPHEIILVADALCLLAPLHVIHEEGLHVNESLIIIAVILLGGHEVVQQITYLGLELIKGAYLP